MFRRLNNERHVPLVGYSGSMADQGSRPCVELTPEGLVIDGLLVIDPDVLDEVREWMSSEGGNPGTERLAEHVGILMSRGARSLVESRRIQMAGIIDDATRRTSAAMLEASGQVRDHVDEALAAHRDAMLALLDGDDSMASEALRNTLDSGIGELSRTLSESLGTAVSVAVRAGVGGSMDEVRSDMSDLKKSVQEVREHLVSADASHRAVQNTAIKGVDYEASMNGVLARLAADMGAEYHATGETTGSSGRSMKGDGVLIFQGSRLVLEYHHGKSRKADDRSDRISSKGWSAYLIEAMTNRQASAGLGVTFGQSGTPAYTALGSTTAVVRCDPDNPDDIDRLRFAVQVFSWVARHRDSGDTESGAVLVEKAKSVMSELGRYESLIKDVDSSARDMHLKAQDLSTKASSLRKSLTTLISRAALELHVGLGHEDAEPAVTP